MVFTKREKVIIAATIAALCLLVLGLYVLTPLLEQRAAVQADKDQLVAKMDQARILLRRRRLLGPKWNGMLAGGMKPDPAEAESQLLRSIRDWSAEVGVMLSSLRPERSTEKLALPEIIVHAAGSGSMDAVSRLLWRIETARIPVKVRMLQLGSRKDGTDDLALHLRVSTLYCPPGVASEERAEPGREAGGGER
jgi:hypothetical protein